MKFHLLIYVTLLIFAILAASLLTSVTVLATGNDTTRTELPDEEPCNLKLSIGRENIVLRARKVYEIEWTPLRNIIKWSNRGYFTAGETVRGLPYGMPSEANYVPLKTSLSEFLDEVADINSRFYKSIATRHARAPYYSLDCSAFVSWAWGEENRRMTGALHEITNNFGRDINKIQLGDALNKPGTHVLLVTSLNYDSDGNVKTIGLMELDPPQAKYNIYGEDNGRPLSEVNKRYLSNGYSIIRYKNIENVVYLHDCVVPIDADYCISCIGNFTDLHIPEFLNNQKVQYLDLMSYLNISGAIRDISDRKATYDYKVSRGMFIYLFSEYINADISTYKESIFLDVPEDEWYAQAIAWAVGIGLIENESSLFYPRQLISNEEIMDIVSNYIHMINTQSSTPLVLVQTTSPRG